MSDTPNIDYLKEEVNKLKSLLDDPHPGFASWCICVATHLIHISKFWLGDKYPEEKNNGLN